MANTPSYVTIFTNPALRICTPLDNITHISSLQHDNVLDKSSAVSLLQVNPSDVAFGMKYMAQQQYQRLIAQTPWLQANTHMAYIQLILKGELQKAMEPVLNGHNMSHMCELIDTNIPHFSHKETAETLLSLLYIGYDNTKPIVHKLLAHCKAGVPHYDLYCLSVMSFVFKAFKKNDRALLHLILQQHSKLINNKTLAVNPDNVYAHCVLTVNLGMYHSVDFWRKCFSYLWDALNYSLPPSACSPEMLATVIQTGHFMSRSAYNSNPRMLHQILTTAAHLVEPHIEHMHPLHLKQVVRALKLSRCLKPPLMVSVDTRIKHILKQHGSNLQISDASNLLNAMNRLSDKQTMLAVENLLYQKLRSETIDIVTLSHIAEALVEVDSCNTDLLWLVQDRIINNADDLVTHFSRYHKIVRFLLRKEFVDVQHKEKLASILIESLFERQHGLVVNNLSATMAYLLPNSTEPIPDELLRKLLASIPHWSEKPLHRLQQSLNQLQLRQRNLSPKLLQQISQIYSVLYANILQRLDSVSCFSDLNMLTQCLALQNRHVDPHIVTTLMDMHLHYATKLTDGMLSDMLSTCSQLKYFNAHLVEQFSLHVQQMSESNEMLPQLFSYFGMVGFEPSCMDKLLEKVLQHIEVLERNGELHSLLQLLSNLLVLEVCPEEPLRRLFSIDFLQQVDDFIQGE